MQDAIFCLSLKPRLAPQRSPLRGFLCDIDLVTGRQEGLPRETLWALATPNTFASLTGWTLHGSACLNFHP